MRPASIDPMEPDTFSNAIYAENCVAATDDQQTPMNSAKSVTWKNEARQPTARNSVMTTSCHPTNSVTAYRNQHRAKSEEAHNYSPAVPSQEAANPPTRADEPETTGVRRLPLRRRLTRPIKFALK